MVAFVDIKGYEDFVKYVESLDINGPPVFVYFSGSKNADGNSWCPDCVEDKLTDKKSKNFWKNKACPFRTDSRIKLMVIPTLIKWKGVQRLEGSQCNKRELLQMLFEDDE
ncbi:unnamed protein product [Leptidea sinapis]|uniref:Thioredoxin domain-containing protein 17 n=1 Tax=Leptidea sinapis TaxID=189913 RepID=A0A5E4PVA4_9NEOP|nr:unnamed protein product [Leptidea sinapis]